MHSFSVNKIAVTVASVASRLVNVFRLVIRFMHLLKVLHPSCVLYAKCGPV